MKKYSIFPLILFLTMVLIFLSSCSSSKEYPKQPGRCKENCETKWEEANRKCKKKRSIDKELCLKHTYWKLNEWM